MEVVITRRSILITLLGIFLLSSGFSYNNFYLLLLGSTLILSIVIGLPLFEISASGRTVKIERYTEGSLKKYFGKELETGKLVYDSVNVEKKRNKHFVDEYKLYTKSVVLSLVKDGKEIQHKNLDKVWEYIRDKDTFYAYIKDETKAFLDELGEGALS